MDTFHFKINFFLYICMSKSCGTARENTPLGSRFFVTTELVRDTFYWYYFKKKSRSKSCGTDFVYPRLDGGFRVTEELVRDTFYRYYFPKKSMSKTRGTHLENPGARPYMLCRNITIANHEKVMAGSRDEPVPAS